MQGRLLSDYFRNEGIMATEEWEESINSPVQFREFESTIRTAYRDMMRADAPNEALTEQELIQPIMNALGWDHYIPQQGTERNQDIPDFLLFADIESKSSALEEPTPNDRFRHAVAVQENKRFYLTLDARDAQDTVQPASPHGQILRYLAAADDASLGKIRWGILTNGKIWRLYDFRTRPRATAYYEADLRHALDLITTADDYTELRKFYLLFRRDAFIPQQGATNTYLEKCLEEAKLFDERVANDISDVVFERVFPNLVAALAGVANVQPRQAHQPALVLLYRILFIMFAEDRGLLPVEHPSYRDYGLRFWLRENQRPEGAKLSFERRNAYLHFRELCRIVDTGDMALGVPPYNGNLFSQDYAPILESHELPDSDFIPVIRDLSHTTVIGESRYVNYRDMSVQQLGSIYERLLEREPITDEMGNIKIVLNRHARKDSGSFYTPQPLVDLIVDQSLEPLIEEKLKAFEDKAKALGQDPRSADERLTELATHDPAEAVLNLRVLDPAMGSGHFLVTAVDYLTDYIANLIEFAPSVPDWTNGKYESPVARQVADIRNAVQKQAKLHEWIVNDTHLSDQAIIRRMVLKRCIYGVDKNPLTVELAKVALWLHSFTVGAPLSFIDHHLRCGDALVGMSTRKAVNELNRLGGIFAQTAIESAELAANAIQQIEELPDSVIQHVHESRALFNKAERKTTELRGVLDFLCGLAWTTAAMSRTVKGEYEKPVIDILEQSANGAEKLLTCEHPPGPESGSKADQQTAALFNQRRRAFRETALSERFLHWEAAFPEVWHNWQHENPTGGFDAVIGNPPWDRIKIQEREWLEQRAPDLARIPRAADRWNALQQLRDQGSDLANELDDEKARSNLLTTWARNSGLYPQLSGGDVNSYSLFVERAQSLIKPNGMVGLLVPAGIYGDANAARFFRSISTSGRLRSLFDFENRRLFFSEVHASFKFCTIAFGGAKRRFENARCGFFLQDAKIAHDSTEVFTLTPDNFDKVNPNTGTAPVFRTRADASLTLAIYDRVPVLVRRATNETHTAWPISHRTMFHAGNDSGKFRTANELDADGYYPIAGSIWKRGDDIALPLYEGKMVQAYNHRAASVVNREDIIYRQGQRNFTAIEDLQNPNFSTRPRFWVKSDASTMLAENQWFLAFKDVTANTNKRTMIAAIIPQVASVGTLRLLLGTDSSFNAHSAALFLANLNSFPLDYVARQKTHGTHLTWYIVEQLPVLTPSDYDIPIGNTTAADLVRDHILRLTYTAHDIAAFARDLGYDGAPFVWDESERIHLRARLDALFFILYGISRNDASHILNRFPIVQQDDESQHGRFLTHDLILAYMNSLEAGDSESIASL